MKMICSLKEWLEEFEQLLGPLAMSDTEKARVLVDHLGGAAREEVMCLTTEEREDLKKLCFSSSDTLQSLTTTFHNRKQGDRESLADFSRSLMRSYGKMQVNTPSSEGAEALAKLRDRSLKAQFVGGARDPSVRRELRRITLSKENESFVKMRQEALYLFQETSEPTKCQCKGNLGR